MNFIEFKALLKDFTVFSLQDIKNFDSHFDRRRLSEWQEKGYIQKIIREYYRFADAKLNEMDLFLIANKIYQPSYVSLEMGLSYYHLIPESVYSITSISSAKTISFATPIGNFVYKSVKPNLLFGTTLLPYWGKQLDSRLRGNDNTQPKIVIGEVEKVILDYFYLHTEIDTKDKIAALRLNYFELQEQINWEKFDKYLAVFNKKALTKRVNLLREDMKNEMSESKSDYVFY